MLEDIFHEFYEEVDSTNDRIKERAREGATQGLVISAGHQTAGKGRIGRKWQSPTNDSISTSMLLRPQGIPVESIPTVTVVAAMAVRAALEEVGLEGKIKWPNDIVIDGKKICGILTEMELKGTEIGFVVCGIGVNVHNKTFTEDIAFKATSVDLELEKAGIDKLGSRKDITYSIWENFKKYYNLFIQTHDMTLLREEYEKYLANKGSRVRIEDPRGPYEAIAKGINNKGNLVVEKDGQELVIDSGEVSVRGIYGYV